jgi:hypothetical protein
MASGHELTMAYSIGYEAKSLPVPGGIDILDVDAAPRAS